MADKLIAKKYAKAIVSRKDFDEFYKNLCIIYQAFCIPRFINILENTQIHKEKKVNFILSFLDQKNTYFENFIKLLADNSRLLFIPEIIEELQKQKSFQNNTYKGIIYSEKKLDTEILKEIEEKLKSKLEAQIKLENKITNNNEIKIDIEDLNYEISFSIKTFQNKISEFILKTI
ncbi:F0F1 ATP synthase subunit delta [Campylobacter sp. TTU-622]|uniref:F0F1 ATP synthase subunit delta n=1 Tax=unclassified Campylobacter TaxID=2593542 RepID=UPI0019074A15|nr:MULTISPECIES: F0F1 ATP synthase subunit delta [unclassified Campylobacter]MBK1971337.1 F0F1 ATP synthase subunit delta [Campylobacter sp. TTU_617]MBK1972511.1 F0F1 ATP synthase subunit delta [Campylobacter sp. TTU-622]